MAYVREACEPPGSLGTPAHDNDELRIRHPGYRDTRVTLLRLHASDRDPDTHAPALHAQFVLEACGLVAGNRWDGFLSTQYDARAATPMAPNAFLVPGNYYFHLPQDPPERPLEAPMNPSDRPLPYPVFLDFQSWVFPHDNLPPRWAQISPETPQRQQAPSRPTSSSTVLQDTVRARDATCRLSGSSTGLHCAHLCPRVEDEWFKVNKMREYNGGRPSTTGNVLRNLLLLRADLHNSMDAGEFVLAPKPIDDVGASQLAVHVLTSHSELQYQYHNRRLQAIPAIAKEYLFVRFAWAIFPSLQGFTDTLEQRHVLVTINNESQARMLQRPDRLPLRDPFRLKLKRSRSGTVESPSTNTQCFKRQRTLDAAAYPSELVEHKHSRGASTVHDASKNGNSPQPAYTDTTDTEERSAKRRRTQGGAPDATSSAEDQVEIQHSRSATGAHQAGKSCALPSQASTDAGKLLAKRRWSTDPPELRGRQRHSNPAPFLDEPTSLASSEASSASPSTPPGSHDDEVSSFVHSRQAQEYLEQQRARSDPYGTWKHRVERHKDVLEGRKSMNSREALEFMQDMGAEVVWDESGGGGG